MRTKIFHCFVLFLIIIHISVCDMFFLGTSIWSYLTTLCEVVFIVVAVQYFKKVGKFDRIEKLGAFYFIFILFFSIINGLPNTNIVSLIGRAIEIATVLMLFHLNRDNLNPLLLTGTITLSICVYCNFYLVWLNPIGIIDMEGDPYFLLGTNYNQIGPKVLCAIVFNILLLDTTKITWVNLFFLSYAGIYSLFLVGSMTSLVSISFFLTVFILSYLLKGKLNKLFFVIGISFVLLFQVFVVFEGDTLMNSDALSFLNLIGKDITFTGRTKLWSYSSDYFWDSPIWGHGFISPREYAYSGFFHGIMKNSHNYIYNVMHKGGIILFITVFLLLKTCYDRVKIDIKKQTAFVVLMAAVVFMIMSLFEAYETYYVFLISTFMFYYPYLQKSNSKLCKQYQ